MIPNSELKAEVRRYYSERADVAVALEIAVHEIVKQHAAPEGPDAEWHESLSYYAVWHMATAVNREIKSSEDEAEPRQGELYPGYKRLQRRYSVNRDGRQWLVPVGEMADEEFDQKITEHRAMSAGHNLHALELQRFKDERNTH